MELGLSEFFFEGSHFIFQFGDVAVLFLAGMIFVVMYFLSKFLNDMILLSEFFLKIFIS